jgi:hypothetical protein
MLVGRITISKRTVAHISRYRRRDGGPVGVLVSSGGKRKGAGRKPNNPPTKKHCVSITDEQARLLRAWGKGDLSAGLRWLVDVAKLIVGKRT